MEARAKLDTSYYEFLNLIQEVSKNSNSIQKTLISKIFQNYDICKIKRDLDKKIAYFDKLLLK
ncbi:MAG: hypothetical protein ACFFBI_04630 [Promethearchaeota archaeon]